MQRIHLAFLAIVAVAVAQESDPPASPPPAAEKQDPNLLLSVALRGPQTATSLVVTAKVKHEPPKDGGMFGGAGGGAVITVQRSMGGGAAPFEGTVEACRMPDGSRIVVSKTSLPGFELHLSDGGAIERTTFADERFSLDQLKAELGPLLDTGALARHLLAAKLASRREGAKWVFQGDVAKDIVRPTVGVNPMNARVLKVGAKLTVSEKGRLEQAAITVTRNDPLREMMRGRGGMRIRMGGAGAPPPPAEDDEKKHDIEGGSTTYTLTFGEKQPSERVRAFQREVARLNETR